MTAEVAVMNAQAVALAADSAVSIDGSTKTFTSADKIFALSGFEPVAAMIHGNASFMGIPWETIVKSYRRQLGKTCFATVAEYARDFAKYLERDSSGFFPTEVRTKQVRLEIRSRLEASMRVIQKAIEVRIERKGSIDEIEVAMYVAAEIEATHLSWAKSSELIPGLTEDGAAKLATRYAEDAQFVQDDVLRDFPMTARAQEHLGDLRNWFLTRVLPEEDATHTSGVVFAGFGVNEYFPHVVEYRFEGLIENHLRYCVRSAFEVSRTKQGAIFAFGQEDMVQTFMDGIDPDFKDQITKSLDQFIVGYSDVILDAVPHLSDDARREMKDHFRRIGHEAFLKYRRSLKEWRRREYAQKTLEVIGILPKDELATVAESLVSLTSLKRRVSKDASVSPPIDVCVISKHDGCVWVKKKHYFPIELNPSFYMRYGHISKLDEENVTNDEQGTGTHLPNAAGGSPPIPTADEHRNDRAATHDRRDT